MMVMGVATEASAARMAVLSRGVGPGSDKPTALVGHAVAEAFATDERFELLNASLALGNPERDKALRQFQIAEDLSQKAREAYDGLDLETAETALKGAIKRYERYAAYIADFKKMSDALLLLGAVNILKGNERGGTAALEQAIGIFPGAEPDPRVFNPAMRVQFSQVASRLGTQPTGTVTVSSSPSYGTIFIDGRFVGVTPMPIEGLTPGRHVVRIEREGFRPWGGVMDIVSRNEASISATLKPSTHFDEYDNLADRAVRVLDDDNGNRSEDRQNALRELAELLDADSLFVSKVRLDGERVRVFCDLYEVHGKKTERTAEHVFAYDMQPATYEREVRLFLHESFGLEGVTPADKHAASAEEGVVEPEDRTLPHAGSRKSCGLVQCRTAKRITVGTLIGAGTVAVAIGGIEWALAKKTHSQWRKTPQTASDQASLRVKGYNQAVSGDVLVGIGLVGVVGGIIAGTVWHPSTSVEDIAAEHSPEPLRRRRGKQNASLNLSMLPISQGAMAQAIWRFP